MKITLLGSLLLLLIVACSDKNKLPKDVLPELQMREVMWDMIRTGEFLNGFVVNRDSVSKKAEIEKWFEKVYQLHHISREVFDKSFAYYQGHPPLMKKILDTLARRQVYVKPVVRDSSALSDTNVHTNLPRPIDTIPRAFDSIRKRFIKNRKNRLNTP